MKTSIFTLLLLFSFNFLFAQDNVSIEEPQFVGEALLLNPDNSYVALEKSSVQFKTKANAGAYIIGIGSVKTRMTVKGCCSSVRLDGPREVQLIVRAVDNNTDPLSIITIFSFEKKKKERRAELESVSTFGGSSSNNMKILSFTAKKFGESSYLLTINDILPGEYGIVVQNPNALDQRSTIVSCFGVDGDQE